MNCCKHKYLVIYRGDDTDFPGNQELIVELNTTRDLTGCSAHVEFQGFRQDFDEIPDDKKLRLVFPSGSTKQFALGAADAKLWLTYGSDDPKKIRTVENRIHIVVTNNINEAYDNDDPQAITVTIKGTDLTWDNIKNKPLLVKTVNGEAPDADGNVDVTAIAEGAVQYDREQTLTDEQKEQAQKNIGTLGKLPLRALPKYLHFLAFDDTYPADAAWLYAQLGPSDMGRCSAVRRGGKLWRKYDWTFDDAAEFVVDMSGNATRFASVGVASVGSRLTENDVMSAVNSRYYKCLPGMTLDGINEKGVVCEINVDGGPKTGWHGDADDDGIHILAAVRWVLDHGETAAQAAAWIADHIIEPQGEMNFHFMVADATSTYIVENGAAYDMAHGTKVLTNYALFDSAYTGGGKERYQLLADGADISAVNFTNAYQSGNNWDSDFESAEQHSEAIRQWAAQGETKEAHRGKTTTDGSQWWQSVHTTEYDFAAKTMKVAVQEVDDWYVFAVGQANVETDDAVTKDSANPVKSSGIWSAIWGALTAIPSGFTSLYDWCVAQLADVSSLVVEAKAIANDALNSAASAITGVNRLFTEKADRATTLSGYGITDARGREDNTCHKTEFGEWSFSGSALDPSETYSVEERFIEHGPSGDVYNYELYKSGVQISFIETVGKRISIDYSSGLPSVEITATRSAVCTDSEKFVTPSYHDPSKADKSDIIDPALATVIGKIADAKLTRDFVNLMVSTNSAHYLTARAGTAGSYTYPPFASAAELRAAVAAHTEQNPQFFYAGEAFTPTKNDWVIVSEDEDHPLGTIIPASRYGFVGTFGSGGSFQYQVSYKLPLTTAQIAALDSEITKALVLWLTQFKGTDTATTLASILAAIEAKANQSDIFGNDGKPSDTFATDLLGKQVAKEAIRANSAQLALDDDGEIIVTMNTED